MAWKRVERYCLVSCVPPFSPCPSPLTPCYFTGRRGHLLWQHSTENAIESWPSQRTAQEVYPITLFNDLTTLQYSLVMLQICHFRSIAQLSPNSSFSRKVALESPDLWAHSWRGCCSTTVRQKYWAWTGRPYRVQCPSSPALQQSDVSSVIRFCWLWKCFRLNKAKEIWQLNVIFEFRLDSILGR